MTESKNGLYSLLLSISLASLVGCNGTSTGSNPGKVLGQDVVTGTSIALPEPENTENPTDTDPAPTVPEPTVPNPTETTTPILGGTCHSDDPKNLCVALKYVVYKNSAGKAVVSEQEAVANLKVVNNLYKTCNISFQIDEYLAEKPADRDLTFNTANYSELDEIREVFKDDSKLLIVTTGSWNRNGSLGNTGANAWANMPGTGIYGVILEEDVGTYSNIVAHEIGHYLNLDHAGSNSNLMSPIIYSTSTQLTASQCQAARNAVTQYWARMRR